MKKVLGLFAIVSLVACSNGDAPATTVDTNSQAYKDSMAKVNAPATPAVVDTTKKDSTAMAPATTDTTKKVEAAPKAEEAHH